MADRVLRSEIAVELEKKGTKRPVVKGAGNGQASGYLFSGTTDSGKRLLKSLSEYASSYEQQKWSRWVHAVKASDFNRLYNSD